LEGRDGWFSIGGEVPFPVEKSSGVVTIDYKRTGFECRFLPESVEKKQIRLRATMRQTTTDESIVARLGTFKAPALRTVELSRTVELAPNEAVVVGEFDSADALAKLPQSGSEKHSSSVTLVVVSVRPLPRKHEASPQSDSIRQAASETPAKQ
jgi:hypothetical protein